ncbi:hypothetical protein TEQG_08598 [Trichophyton equinum CBS 127.97]|uniref:Uncharacterized protein n=1 Tax=Trichophyton equinum (strain ATCC MYA-4606 / CBS 127.97) TaxID=559882 RepID=F2PJW4_TRIEC|nr:hypothetical protein TEQG_08598 [Trichophyton equinum CBS 127.97]
MHNRGMIVVLAVTINRSDTCPLYDEPHGKNDKMWYKSIFDVGEGEMAETRHRCRCTTLLREGAGLRDQHWPLYNRVAELAARLPRMRMVEGRASSAKVKADGQVACCVFCIDEVDEGRQSVREVWGVSTLTQTTEYGERKSRDSEIG